VTGLGKLNHMRVSLLGLIMFVVGWCCVVHLRRREAVGRVETEMMRLPCRKAGGAQIAQPTVWPEGVVLPAVIFD